MKKLYCWLLALATIFCIFVGSAHHIGGVFRGRDLVTANSGGKVLWEGGTAGADSEKESASAASSASADGTEQTVAGESADKPADPETGTAADGTAEPETAADAAEGSSGTAESREASGITRIEIDARIMDIVIRPGRETKASYSGNDREELIPVIREEDGVLRITQKPKRTFDFTQLAVRSVLTVTLAEDVDLDQLTVELDMGNLDMQQAVCGGCRLHSSMGDLDLENCSLGDAFLSTDMGDIDAEDCAFGELTAENNMGDIEISTGEDLSGRDMDLLTDLGDVKVNEKKYGRQFTQKGSGAAVFAHTDLGDVEITYAS